MAIFAGITNFRLWLKADIQSPEIEVRFTPNNGHSEAHAGLPLVTQRRSLAVFESGMVSTLTMVFRHLCMVAGTIRQYRQKYIWQGKYQLTIRDKP